MLRSINSHTMYLEHFHRLMFYEEAPNLLLRISTLGLSVVSATPFSSKKQGEDEDDKMFQGRSYGGSNETLSEASLLSSLLESHYQRHRSSQQAPSTQVRASSPDRRSMENILVSCGNHWPNYNHHASVSMATDAGDTMSITSSSASTSSIYSDLTGGEVGAVGGLGDSTMHGITSPNCSSYSDLLGTCSLPIRPSHIVSVANLVLYENLHSSIQAKLDFLTDDFFLNDSMR